MRLCDIKLAFETLDHQEDEEAPHSSWRDVHAALERSTARGRNTRMALKSPATLIGSQLLFRGLSKQAAAEVIAETVKRAGDWEQGYGGSSAGGVMAMTPRHLGIQGGGLGGASMMQSMASQFRPTMAGNGWGVSDMSSLANAYTSMAGGGGVGW